MRIIKVFPARKKKRRNKVLLVTPSIKTKLFLYITPIKVCGIIVLIM